MPETNEFTPATVPEQPEAKPPLRKGMPVIIALVVIVGLIGIANVPSLLSGTKKIAPASSLTLSPTTPNAQQVSSFETQQQMQARHDAEERQRQQALEEAMQQLQQEQSVPGPESATAAPMTPAQRDAIYGGSSNAPQHTSNVSEAHEGSLSPAVRVCHALAVLDGPAESKESHRDSGGIKARSQDRIGADGEVPEAVAQGAAPLPRHGDVSHVPWASGQRNPGTSLGGR